MRRTSAVMVALLLCGLAACGPETADGPTAGQSTPRQSPSAEPEHALPAGWRWESYGGVQVGVPGDWGWGNGTQRLSQWCIANEAETARSIVGRPGPATLVACPGQDRSPSPETLIENTGQVVGFSRTEDRSDGVSHEGDRTTVRLHGVVATVQARPVLRRRIVETVHRVGVDSFGCPATHPISNDPDRRPEPADVAGLKEVSAVSACKYELARGPSSPEPRLLSSLQVEGAAAARAIQDVARAPVGGGPDNPAQCLPSVSYGDDVIVLRVRSSAGRSDIVMRYSGCDHNGFDDGVAVRSLTAAAVAPFVAGPNAVFSFDGPQAKVSMLGANRSNG